MGSKRVLVAAGVLAVAGVAGGVAYAAVPDSGGVIRACYKIGGLLQEKGALRVSDDGRCRSNEVELSWNQVGPVGPVGPSGATGPSGPAGPSGAPGVDGADGQNGVDGRDGAVGPRGPQGDPGPSEVIYRRGSAALNNHIPAAVITQQLQPGSYALFGRADLFNHDGDEQYGSCRFSLGNEGTIRLGAFNSGSDTLTITVQDTVVLTQPGTVTFACSTYNGNATNGQVTIIRTGAVYR